MRCTFNFRTPLKTGNWTIEGRKFQFCIAGIEAQRTINILVCKACLVGGCRRKRASVIGVEGIVASFWREIRGNGRVLDKQI